MLGTILLIMLVLLGFGAVTLTFTNLFSGVTGAINVTSDGSQISVNAASGGGMMLVVINNKGPGTVRLTKIILYTVTSGTNVTFTPTSSTQAAVTGGLGSLTASIIGGTNVGFISSPSPGYLAIPQGQSASFRMDVSSGLTALFPPNQRYIMLVNHAGGVVKLNIESVSE